MTTLFKATLIGMISYFAIVINTAAFSATSETITMQLNINLKNEDAFPPTILNNYKVGNDELKSKGNITRKGDGFVIKTKSLPYMSNKIIARQLLDYSLGLREGCVVEATITQRTSDQFVYKLKLHPYGKGRWLCKNVSCTNSSKSTTAKNGSCKVTIQ